MKSRSTILICCLVVGVLLTVLLLLVPANAAECNAQVVPKDLKDHPGAQYYLVFVTRDGRDATSKKIEDYNKFVDDQARLCPVFEKLYQELKKRWLAIGSTSTENADQNLKGMKARLPIYLVDGMTLVVKRAGNLFAAVELNKPINKDQFTNEATASDVWTGTKSNGMKSDDPLGSTLVTTGDSGKIDTEWIESPLAANKDFKNPLYAISPLLTVPKK
jgi:hypothetical protein